MEMWEQSETVDPEVRAYVYSLVNAVGGRSTYDNTYAIGDDALATLKDIRRWLILYDEKTNRLDVKRCLAEANLVKGDLLEILALWGDDASESGLKSRLALVCLELLVPLTWPVELEEERTTVNTHRHLPYLQLAQVDYKRAILHHEGTQILRKVVRIALPSMATPRMERSKRDEGVIMLVLYLLRHLVMITQPQYLPSQGDENDISRAAVIDAFHAQDIFNLLLTLGSAVGDEFQEHDVETLEILYHLLRGIDPKKLFMKRERLADVEMQQFRELVSKEKAMLSSYNKTAPTRHNRFGTTIWVKRDGGKLSTVSGQNTITNQSTTLQQMDASKKWNKPKYRGRLAQHFDERSDFGMRIDLPDATRSRLRGFVEDFLDSSFNHLFSSLRKAIERELERVKPSNVKQYFYLINWFLSAEAARAEHEASPSRSTSDESPFAYIAAVLDQETFVLLNRSMQRAADEKDWQSLYANLLALTQILQTVQRMAESGHEEDREIAENIQNRIFYEEATHDRLAAVLRGYTHQGFAYLDAATECVHVFVRMLERYSKQNADLQIRSKRRARRKAKQAPGGGGGGGGGGGQGDGDAEDVAEEEREVQRAASERKFDFARFVAKFVTQRCADTFVSLLHFHAELDAAQVQRCHRYLYRLAFKADLAVLLFRVDTLLLFQRLIKGPGGLDRSAAGFGEWEMLVRQVFRKCIKWLSKETEGEGWRETCVVEMLFSKMPGTLFYLQNGFERVVERRAPRPPAELEFKASVEEGRRVGVAVGVMLEKAKVDDLKWIKEQLQKGIEERKAWEDGDAARAAAAAQDAEPEQTDSPERAAAPSMFLAPGSEERKVALFRDKHLRLLLTTLGFERLGLVDEQDAPWFIPSRVSAAQLGEMLDQVQKAEFDPPTFEDGKAASDMIRNKSTARRAAARFEEGSNSEDGDSDVGVAVGGQAGEEQLFPANLREKRKLNPDAAQAKKRRRLNRRAGEDESLSDVERQAEARRAKEQQKQSKIKSKLFVTDSDEESDEERDTEFFRLEEERRQKMKGVIRKALLVQEEREKTGGKKGKKGKGRKGEEEDEVDEQEDMDEEEEEEENVIGGSRVDEENGNMQLDLDLDLDEDEDGPRMSPKPKRLLFEELGSDEESDAGNDNNSDAAARAWEGESETGPDRTKSTPPLRKKSVNVNGVASNAPGFADDDDDDDDGPVVKPVGRRARAGFILGDSDSE